MFYCSTLKHAVFCTLLIVAKQLKYLWFTLLSKNKKRTNHSFVGKTAIGLALTRQNIPSVLMTEYGFFVQMSSGKSLESVDGFHVLTMRIFPVSAKAAEAEAAL